MSRDWQDAISGNTSCKKTQNMMAAADGYVFGLFIRAYLLKYYNIVRNECQSMKEQLYYGAKFTLCYLCILYYGEYWGGL